MKEPDIDIRVVVLPDLDGPRLEGDLDPGDVTFYGDDRPILQWRDHYPVHGPGWLLLYLEPDGNEVGDYYIGGRLADADWALEQARSHMALVWQEPV